MTLEQPAWPPTAPSSSPFTTRTLLVYLCLMLLIIELPPATCQRPAAVCQLEVRVEPKAVRLSRVRISCTPGSSDHIILLGGDKALLAPFLSGFTEGVLWDPASCNEDKHATRYNPVLLICPAGAAGNSTSNTHSSSSSNNSSSSNQYSVTRMVEFSGMSIDVRTSSLPSASGNISYRWRPMVQIQSVQPGFNETVPEFLSYNTTRRALPAVLLLSDDDLSVRIHNAKFYGSYERRDEDNGKVMNAQYGSAVLWDYLPYRSALTALLQDARGVFHQLLVEDSKFVGFEGSVSAFLTGLCEVHVENVHVQGSSVLDHGVVISTTQADTTRFTLKHSVFVDNGAVELITDRERFQIPSDVAALTNATFIKTNASGAATILPLYLGRPPRLLDIKYFNFTPGTYAGWYSGLRNLSCSQCRIVASSGRCLIEQPNMMGGVSSTVLTLHYTYWTGKDSHWNKAYGCRLTNADMLKYTPTGALPFGTLSISPEEHRQFRNIEITLGKWVKINITGGPDKICRSGMGFTLESYYGASPRMYESNGVWRTNRKHFCSEELRSRQSQVAAVMGVVGVGMLLAMLRLWLPFFKLVDRHMARRKGAAQLSWCQCGQKGSSHGLFGSCAVGFLKDVFSFVWQRRKVVTAVADVGTDVYLLYQVGAGSEVEARTFWILLFGMFAPNAITTAVAVSLWEDKTTDRLGRPKPPEVESDNPCADFVCTGCIKLMFLPLAMPFLLPLCIIFPVALVVNRFIAEPVSRRFPAAVPGWPNRHPALYWFSRCCCWCCWRCCCYDCWRNKTDAEKYENLFSFLTALLEAPFILCFTSYLYLTNNQWEWGYTLQTLPYTLSASTSAAHLLLELWEAAGQVMRNYRQDSLSDGQGPRDFQWIRTELFDLRKKGPGVSPPPPSSTGHAASHQTSTAAAAPQNPGHPFPPGQPVTSPNNNSNSQPSGLPAAGYLPPSSTRHFYVSPPSTHIMSPYDPPFTNKPFGS